jgi:hypothetical protein
MCFGSQNPGTSPRMGQRLIHNALGATIGDPAQRAHAKADMTSFRSEFQAAHGGMTARQLLGQRGGQRSLFRRA